MSPSHTRRQHGAPPPGGALAAKVADQAAMNSFHFLTI